MTASKLTTRFPDAQHPIIISAPMLGTSNGTLAAEVSKAGGIGESLLPLSSSHPSSAVSATYQVNNTRQQESYPAGSTFLPSLRVRRPLLNPNLSSPPTRANHQPNQTPTPKLTTATDLRALETELLKARTVLSLPSSAPLPVGVGFILASETFTPSTFLATTLPLLLHHRPAAIWLFAPLPEALTSGTFRDIVKELKKNGFLVICQVCIQPKPNPIITARHN